MLDVMKSRPAYFKAWLAVILFAVLLISCSSGSSNGGGDGDPPGSLYAGVTECYLCHYPDDAIARFSGEDIVDKWLNGPHGNDESISPAFQKYDDHPNNTGFPYYGFAGLGTSPDCTLVCHDQLGDGESLEDFWIATGIEYLGIVNRPIVGCESCHGEGMEHKNSVGLLSPQYARPDPDRCGQCHNSEFDHNEQHPEGDNIYEDYITSPHADSIEDPNYVIYGNPASGVQPLCSKCHTDEGAKIYKDVHGGHDELEAALDGLDPLFEATVVQCRTCHNPHDPGVRSIKWTKRHCIRQV